MDSPKFAPLRRLYFPESPKASIFLLIPQQLSNMFIQNRIEYFKTVQRRELVLHQPQYERLFIIASQPVLETHDEAVNEPAQPWSQAKAKTRSRFGKAVKAYSQSLCWWILLYTRMIAHETGQGGSNNEGPTTVLWYSERREVTILVVGECRKPNYRRPDHEVRQVVVDDAKMDIAKRERATNLLL